MKAEQIHITYTVFDEDGQLTAADAALVREARTACAKAYAPYSNFFVGAAALLANGQTVSGANQENASFPVAICAERVLLSAISAVYTGMAVQAIAVSYASQQPGSLNNVPVTPCGMCRQAILEQEQRQQQPIRLLLCGQSGPVILVETAASLLPLAFQPSLLPANKPSV